MAEATICLGCYLYHFRDINDNKPVFQRSNIETNVTEDAQVGIIVKLHSKEDYLKSHVRKKLCCKLNYLLR